MVEIPVVARKMLEVPRHFAGVWIEGERGVRVEQVRFTGAAKRLRQWSGRAGTPIGEV